ncbi:serine hydrolase domain-containing protein [Dyella halodurans]|uniref:Serine hydrolase domain-containing protein n=1 Tax=Dyella halodurans TaxID=1920171 RepID=A0ABV9C925_9GAMM|nr:serine hydrolase domain-containing protein [Dyella halodurans]
MRTPRIVLLAAGMMCAAHALAPSDPFEAIRRSIPAQLQQQHVPSLAVAVAQDGRIVWEQGFGLADKEHQRPATAQTMYSLASISKPLTATALMTLVRAGKLDLDHPINDYLGNSPLVARIGDARNATVRRVANHSSGLPEHYQFFYANEPWRRPTADIIIQRYGQLMTPPGETFRYSNLGYGILDHVIARLAGKSFAEVMHDAVFAPLGMQRSAVDTTARLGALEAVRYGHDGQPIPPYQTDHDGASAIYASAHDMARFGMFQLKSHLTDQAAILPDALIDAMHQPTMDEGNGKSYGVGWEISQQSGYEVISHDGDMPGVRTELRLIPARNLVVVVLTNAEERLAPVVADQIMQAMLPGWTPAPKSPSSTTTTFEPPDEWIGVWKGTVDTYQGAIPITLQVLPSGDIKVTLEDQLTSLLNEAHITKSGFLRGVTTGSLHIDDAARRPYVLGFNLKLRDGHRLDGAITARADDDGVSPTHGLFPSVDGQPRPQRIQNRGFVLAQWAELSKQPTTTPSKDRP